MRSRTEMVTTTFVDSEEDYSDDDDSEEDWRPSASSKNGKKQKHQKSSGGSSKKGRKRKGAIAGANAKGSSKRKSASYAAADSDEDDEDDEDNSEEEYDYEEFETVAAGSTPKKAPTSLPPKKQFSEKNSSVSASGNGTGSSTSDPGGQLKLMVYIKDLAGDYSKNNRLCLWRKDKNNLLQKYIRVKTTPEEFLFTSSSVVSLFSKKLRRIVCSDVWYLFKKKKNKVFQFR